MAKKDKASKLDENVKDLPQVLYLERSEGGEIFVYESLDGILGESDGPQQFAEYHRESIIVARKDTVIKQI